MNQSHNLKNQENVGSVKTLAKDTAIYGLSSIIGRFLNWCLVPLYTILFPADEYGIVTYIYSVVALALVFLTYGMETGFFRFANHERWKDPMQVYSTALISLASSGTLFMAAVLVLLPEISRWMECPSHPSYIWMMALCTAVDAFTALPFCYLRYSKRPVRFAVLKLVNIGLNIGLNIFFLLLCPWLNGVAPQAVGWFYDPTFGIGYIFLSNLISSAVTLLMLVPELRGFRWSFSSKLWREMLAYSAPLLVLGVAGIMNQTLDKIMLPWLSTSADPMGQLGIYGACYKIGIVMVMFAQAFRFAYEPFIFAQHKEKGGKSVQAYADAMKFFIVMALFIFLGVMFYLGIIKYFISPKYFSGLAVVPVIMLAELFFGVVFNLSIWYKLSDKTMWGAWLTLGGLAVTVGMNVLLVPRYGYMGSAWAAFSCYFAMMVASWLLGRKHFPIPYPVKRIGAYTLLAAVLYVAGMYLLDTGSVYANYVIRAMLLAAYLVTVMRLEKITPGSLAAPIFSKFRR